jgi:hypothetical protein
LCSPNEGCADPSGPHSFDLFEIQTFTQFTAARSHRHDLRNPVARGRLEEEVPFMAVSIRGPKSSWRRARRCLFAAVALAALGAGCVGNVDSEPGFEDSLSTLGDVAEVADKAGDPTENGARIWTQSVRLTRCATWNLSENYSTGRYNVHRFVTSLPAGDTVRIRFLRSAGVWSPAVVVFDTEGELVYDGAVAGGHAVVTAIPVATGAEGGAAEVELEASAPVDVNVYVTSWAVLASGFEGSVPRDARYELRMAHECTTPAGTGELATVYAGLDLDGVPVPRAGVANTTLRRTLGISVEPYGPVVDHDGMSFVSGRASWFGGPNDRSVGSQETGAVTGERLRSLNSPASPSADDLADRPGDFYYLAMRWDYAPAGISYWRTARLLVVNPSTGAAVVVRPVDWGPNTSTRRIIDLSPQAMVDLDVTTDDTVIVSFALPSTPLGPVE